MVNKIQSHPIGGIGLCIKKYIAKGNTNIPPKNESKKVTISE